VSATFSSIAVVIAFLALIYVTKQLERSLMPIWDGCSTTLPPRVARHSCANNVGAMKSVSELMKPS
jgi:hypothetical protein